MDPMDDYESFVSTAYFRTSAYAAAQTSTIRPQLHVLLPSYTSVPVSTALRVWHHQAKNVGEDLPPNVLLFGVSRTEFILRRSIEETRTVDWSGEGDTREGRREVAFLDVLSQQPALLRAFLRASGPLSLAPADADGEGGDPVHAPLDRIAAALEPRADRPGDAADDWDGVSALASLALATGRVGDVAACVQAALRAARRGLPPPRPAGAAPVSVEAALRGRQVQRSLEAPGEELLRAITSGSRSRGGAARDAAMDAAVLECAVAVGPRHVYTLDRAGLHKGLPLPPPAPPARTAAPRPPPSAPSLSTASPPTPPHGGPFGLAYAHGTLVAFAAPAHAARAAAPAPNAPTPAPVLGRLLFVDPVSLAVAARVPLVAGDGGAGPSDELRLLLPPEARYPFSVCGAGPALYLLATSDPEGLAGSITALEISLEAPRSRAPRAVIARAVPLDAGAALGGSFGKLTDERRRRARAYTNGQEMVLVLPDTAGGPLHYVWRLSLAAPRAPPLSFASHPPCALDGSPAFCYDWYRNRVCVAGVRLALLGAYPPGIASAIRASVAAAGAAAEAARGGDGSDWGMSVDPDCWGGEEGEEGGPAPPAPAAAAVAAVPAPGPDGDESDGEEARAGAGAGEVPLGPMPLFPAPSTASSAASSLYAATAALAERERGGAQQGAAPPEAGVAFFPNGGLPDPASPFCRGRPRPGDGEAGEVAEWGPAPPPSELGAPAAPGPAAEAAAEAWAAAAALLAHAARLASPFATPRSAYGRAAMRRGVLVHRPRVVVRIYNAETTMRARPTALGEDPYRSRGEAGGAPRLRFRLRYFYLMCRDWLSVALEVDGEQRGGPVALFSPDRSALRLTEEGRARGWAASPTDLTLTAPARDAAPLLATCRPAGPSRPARPDALACFTARRCAASDPFAPPASSAAAAAAALAASCSPSASDPWARYAPDFGEGTPRLRPFAVDLSLRSLDRLLGVLEELQAAAPAPRPKGKQPAAPRGPLETLAGQALRLLHAQLQQLSLHGADVTSLGAPPAFRDDFVARLEAALLGLLRSPAAPLREEAFAALRAALPTAFCEPRHVLSLLARLLPAAAAAAASASASSEPALLAPVLECAASVLQPSAAAGRALAALCPSPDELPPLLSAALEAAAGPLLAALRAWPASDPWAALAACAPAVRLLARYFQPSLLAAAVGPDREAPAPAPAPAPSAEQGDGADPASLLLRTVLRCAPANRPRGPAAGPPRRRLDPPAPLGPPRGLPPALWAAAEPSDAREAAAILALAGAWGDAAARVHARCAGERAAAVAAQRAAERCFAVPLAGELEAEGEVVLQAGPALPFHDLDVSASVEGAAAPSDPAPPFLVRVAGLEGRQAAVIRSAATGRLVPTDGSLAIRTLRHERRVRVHVTVGPRAAPRQPPAVLGGSFVVPGLPATAPRPPAPPPPPRRRPRLGLGLGVGVGAPSAISADAASERFGAGTGAYEAQAAGRTVVRTAPSSVSRQLVFFSQQPLASAGRAYCEVRLGGSTAALVGLAAGASEPRFLQSALRHMRFFWVQHGERFAGRDTDAAMESAAPAATFGSGDSVGLLVDYGARRLRMLRNGEVVGGEELGVFGADVASGATPLHLAVGLLGGSATLVADAQPPALEEDEAAPVLVVGGAPSAPTPPRGPPLAPAASAPLPQPLAGFDAGAASLAPAGRHVRVVLRPAVGPCDEWQWPSEQRLRALECLARRAGSLVSRAGGSGEEQAARYWLDRPLFFQAAARLDRAAAAPAGASPSAAPPADGFLWRLLEGDEPARAWVRALRAACLSASEQLAAAAVGPGAALVDDAERAALAAALKYGPAPEEAEAAGLAEAAEACFNRFLAGGALAPGDPPEGLAAAVRRAHGARVALVRRSTARGAAEEGPARGRYAQDAEGLVRRARLLLALRDPLPAAAPHAHSHSHSHSHSHGHGHGPSHGQARAVHALLPPARTRSEGVERDKLLAECSRVLRSGAPPAASEAARFVSEWGLDAPAMAGALERREALARRRADGLALFSALLALPPSGLPADPRDWQLRVGVLRVLAHALRGDSFAGGVLCCGPAEQRRVSEAFAALASQLVASLRPQGTQALASPRGLGLPSPAAPASPEVRAATLKALLCMTYRRCEHDVLAGSGGLLAALESLHVPPDVGPAFDPAQAHAEAEAAAAAAAPRGEHPLAPPSAIPAPAPPAALLAGESEWEWAVFELQVLLLCTMAVQAMRNAHAELSPEAAAAAAGAGAGSGGPPSPEPAPDSPGLAVALRALGACGDALGLVMEALERSLSHPEAGQLEDIPEALRHTEAGRLAHSLARLWRAAIRLLSAALRAAQLHPAGRAHAAARLEPLLRLLDLTGKSTGDNGDLRDYEAQTQWVIFQLLQAALPVADPAAFGAEKLEGLARAAGRRFLPPRASVAARRLLEKLVPECRTPTPKEELILWRVASWGAVGLFRALLTASGPAWRAAARRLLLDLAGRAAALLSRPGDGADVSPEGLADLRAAATLLCALGPADYPNYGAEASLVAPSGRETRALVVDVDDLLQDDATAQLLATSALSDSARAARAAAAAGEAGAPAGQGGYASSDGEGTSRWRAPRGCGRLPVAGRGGSRAGGGGGSSMECVAGLIAACRVPPSPSRSTCAPSRAEAVLGPEEMGELAGHLAALLRQGSDEAARAAAAAAAATTPAGSEEAGRVAAIRAKLAYIAASAAHSRAPPRPVPQAALTRPPRRLATSSAAFRACVAADAGPSGLFAALLRAAGQASEPAAPLARARLEAHRLDVALWTRVPLKVLAWPRPAPAAPPAELWRPRPIVTALLPDAFDGAAAGPARDPFLCVIPFLPAARAPQAQAEASASAAAPAVAEEEMPQAPEPSAPEPTAPAARRSSARHRAKRARREASPEPPPRPLGAGPAVGPAAASAPTVVPAPAPASAPVSEAARTAERIRAAVRAGASGIVLRLSPLDLVSDILPSLFATFRRGPGRGPAPDLDSEGDVSPPPFSPGGFRHTPDSPPYAPSPPTPPGAGGAGPEASAAAVLEALGDVPVPIFLAEPEADSALLGTLDYIGTPHADFPPPASEAGAAAGAGADAGPAPSEAAEAEAEEAVEAMLAGFAPADIERARAEPGAAGAAGPLAFRLLARGGPAAARHFTALALDDPGLDAALEEQDIRRMRRRRALRAARRRARRRAARGGREGRGVGPREPGEAASLLELVDKERGEATILGRSRKACLATASLAAAAACVALLESALPEPAPASSSSVEEQESPAWLAAAASSPAAVRRLLRLLALAEGPLADPAGPAPRLAARLAASLAAGAASSAAIDGELRARLSFPVALRLPRPLPSCLRLPAPASGAAAPLPRVERVIASVWVRPRPAHGAETPAEEVRVTRDCEALHAVEGGLLTARGGWGPARVPLHTAARAPELFFSVAEQDAELAYTADVSARAGGAAAAPLLTREAVACLAAAVSVAQGTYKEAAARLLAALLRRAPAIGERCAAEGGAAPALQPLEAALVRFANACCAGGPPGSLLEPSSPDAPRSPPRGPCPPRRPALELLTAVTAARAAWRAAGLPEPEAPAAPAAQEVTRPSASPRASRLRLKAPLLRATSQPLSPAQAPAAAQPPAAAGSSERPSSPAAASAAEAPAPRDSKRRRVGPLAGDAAAAAPPVAPPAPEAAAASAPAAPLAEPGRRVLELAAVRAAARAAARGRWGPPAPPSDVEMEDGADDSASSSSSSSSQSEGEGGGGGGHMAFVFQDGAFVPLPPSLPPLPPLPAPSSASASGPSSASAEEEMAGVQAEVERLRHALSAARARLHRTLASVRAPYPPAASSPFLTLFAGAGARAPPRVRGRRRSGRGEPAAPNAPAGGALVLLAGRTRAGRLARPAGGPAPPGPALERLRLLRDVLLSLAERSPLPAAFLEHLGRGGREALGLPPGAPLRPALGALLAARAPLGNERWTGAMDAELRALLDGAASRGELPSLFGAPAAAGLPPQPPRTRAAAPRWRRGTATRAPGPTASGSLGPPAPPRGPRRPGRRRRVLAGRAGGACRGPLRGAAAPRPLRTAPPRPARRRRAGGPGPRGRRGAGEGAMTAEGIAGRAAVLLGLGRLRDAPGAGPGAGPPSLAELLLRLRPAIPDKRGNVLRPALAAARPSPSIPPPFAAAPDSDGPYVRQRLSVAVDKRRALGARLALSSAEPAAAAAASAARLGAGAGGEEGAEAWPPAPAALPEALFESVFGQLFTQLAGRDPRDFHVTGDQAWHTNYTAAGEEGVDMGGLFRETVSLVADELNSDWLPLFAPTPNARAQVGTGQDEVLPRAAARGPAHLALFEFVGRVMGLALRTAVQLPLRLPSAVWRALVQEPLAAADLRSFDSLCHASVEQLRRPSPSSAGEEAPRAPPRVYPLSDGTRVDLWERVAPAHRAELEGGRRGPRPAAPSPPRSSRCASATSSGPRRALRIRPLLPCSRAGQVEAMRRGLAAVVGAGAVAAHTGAELAAAVCGEADVDLDRLQRHTAYSGGFRAEDASVQYLWEVLRGFTPHERELFLRFVWGRSRLPPSEAEWPRPFTVALMDVAAGGEDMALPRAHTCFFQLDLPRYSSLAVARSKIWYAVTYCRDMGTV
eukprot:tig00020684_g12864.t1